MSVRPLRAVETNSVGLGRPRPAEAGSTDCEDVVFDIMGRRPRAKHGGPGANVMPLWSVIPVAVLSLIGRDGVWCGDRVIEANELHSGIAPILAPHGLDRR